MKLNAFFAFTQPEVLANFVVKSVFAKQNFDGSLGAHLDPTVSAQA